MTWRVFRNGSTLITCTLILVIVSVLAVGLAATSGVNLQIADNQRRANSAFASAESGLEVSRYWLDQIRIPSTTPASNYLGAVIAAVDVNLAANGVTNFRVSPDGTIPSVVLNPLPGYTFQGQWSVSPTRPDVLKVTTCGISGLMSRTVIVDYRIMPYYFKIFDRGIATVGPIECERNATFAALHEPWEASVYIACPESALAFSAGMHITFGGEVLWGNDDASYYAGSGLTATGEVRPLYDYEEPPEFPVPDTLRFQKYATGPVITSSTDLSGATSTWTNASIAPNTNPVFGGNVVIQGILYVEAPNRVMFPKNTTLQGMIVGNGSPVANPDGNYIYFGDPCDAHTPSNFSSGAYPEGSQFDAIRQEQGSCILAPGFEVAFWKNFTAINGVIAASGLTFAKNSTATVNGTLINYSNEPLYIGNNIVFNFDRLGMIDIPAGFDLYRVPIYDPGSYALAY